MTVATLGAMKNANKQLKTQMEALNIDDVDDVQDDLAELMEEMNEVNESLARSYAMPEDIDEADLEANWICWKTNLRKWTQCRVICRRQIVCLLSRQVRLVKRSTHRLLQPCLVSFIYRK